MPQTCPHCGTELPAVVDAYCPECRGELAVAARPLARPTSPEPAPAPAPTHDGPGAPARIISAAGAVAHLILAAVMLVVAVSFLVVAGREALCGEIVRALAFALFGALWACGAWSQWRNARGEKASVSGREKTQASENEPK